MPKNLVIVESPAKARTIGRFLGSDYEVESSFGHIRDLPKKGIGVDVKKHFEPTYEVSDDKARIVRDLKAAAKGKTVWLASDEDREGEAIAWHVCAVLGLDPAKTNRIVFHEITKPAITAAVAKPRTLDMKLVDAQQARRILDRLVGYELSPVLWKKVRTGLSAGRVQSVAVRLIVEREREIKAYEAKSSFKVSAIFETDGKELSAELTDKIKDLAPAKKFLESIKDADFTIGSVDQKPGMRSPGAPFTTSTLQQEASRKLGYSVRQTMTLAQRLYEHGHITYMRTDSTNLSGLAIDAAKKYITGEYGEKYCQTRQYKTKNQSAQEAHEAIRPTHFNKLEAGADPQQVKLYQLIWRRALASQMAPAAIEKTEVLIDISGHKEQFLSVGEVLNFDGFLKVYGGGKDDKILPAVKVGQKLKLDALSALESFTKPPARYSEAALVKKLEELGIGRPSTYAPTIGTIQTREYVEKKDLEGTNRTLRELVLEKSKIIERTQEVVVGADRAKLTPTPLADIVTDFLLKYFESVMDYDFTAQAEKELDHIAEGKLTWQDMLAHFYDKFHPLVEKSADASRAETVQARKLGTDPKTGLKVYARLGRFGPMLQLGETPPRDKKSKKDEDDEIKPRFAPMPEGAELDGVTLEQALPMFELPRVVGKTTDGQEITADIGRFGPYIKVGSAFTSIKDHDPMTIKETEARTILAEKAKVEAERIIADFGNKLQVLNGRYGPYVTDGKENAKIPKDQDPKKLTEADVKKLLKEKAAQPASKGRYGGRSRRTKAKK
jgi:DNA topoisomerase I